MQKIFCTYMYAENIWKNPASGELGMDDPPSDEIWPKIGGIIDSFWGIRKNAFAALNFTLGNYLK